MKLALKTSQKWLIRLIHWNVIYGNKDFIQIYIAIQIVYEYGLIDILNEQIKFDHASFHELIFQADPRAEQAAQVVQLV